MTTINVYDESNVPGFAKHASSFKNDERCYAVHYVTGLEYAPVLEQTLHLFNRDSTLIDYDVAYSTEGGMWVGITCRDK